jgi:hypothetical protein
MTVPEEIIRQAHTSLCRRELLWGNTDELAVSCVFSGISCPRHAVNQKSAQQLGRRLSQNKIQT